MSEHFLLSEFLHSDTALSCNIENLPTWDDIDRLKRLAGVLEEIRRILGDLPMVVSSGYRCPALNSAVGGVYNSAHLYGYAADFVCPAFGTPTEVVAELKPHLYVLQIDQLIDETGWVHVGLCEGEPRCECFKL
jgi:hypothetical protein